MALHLFTEAMFMGPDSPNATFPYNNTRVTTLYIETDQHNPHHHHNHHNNTSNMLAASTTTTTTTTNHNNNSDSINIFHPDFLDFTTQSLENINDAANQTSSHGLPGWQVAIFYASFILILIVAAGGNIIVIWIVLAHKRMRTVTNYFLVNLAVADVFIAIFNVLFHFTVNLYSTWFFGLGYCKFSFFLATCTISVSVLTLMAIAVDRYIAIIHPLRPRLTGRVVLTVITVIWFVSFLLALPYLIYSDTYEHPGGRVTCYVKWEDSGDSMPSKRELAYQILLMVFNFILPAATLAGTYLRIGWELWGTKAIGESMAVQNERIKSKRKVVKMMITVVVIFILCWLPTHVYFILASIPSVWDKVVHWKHVRSVYLLIYWLAMSNSMYNPIIYCLMNARFRAGFGRAFRGLFRLSSCGHGQEYHDQHQLSELAPTRTRYHSVYRFRHGFLRFFRWCPCRPCTQRHNLLMMERVQYSTRMGSERSEKLNGSLLHTTEDTLDDHMTSPSSATYRMHPIKSRLDSNHGNGNGNGNRSGNGGGNGGGGYNKQSINTKVPV